MLSISRCSASRPIRHDLMGEQSIGVGKRLHRVDHHLLGDPAHLGNAALEHVEFLVVGFDGVLVDHGIHSPAKLPRLRQRTVLARVDGDDRGRRVTVAMLVRLARRSRICYKLCCKNLRFVSPDQPSGGRTMNGQVTSGLTALTSGWKPAPSVAAGDIAGARAALAASLAAGKTPQDLDSAIASRPASAVSVQAPAQPASGVLAFTQSALGVTVANPLAIPAWANGMAQGRSFGPFIDAFGNQNNVITFQLTQSQTFTYGTAANGFAVFPVTGSPSSATSLTLGGGSVWFEATLLASGAPAGSFCGFRIASGTLSSSAAVTLESGAYVVPSGATLTMTATLAPPAAGSGSPGADLTSATIALPQTVTIRFTQTTAMVSALGDASLTLYGAKVGLSWTNPTAQTGPGPARRSS